MLLPSFAGRPHNPAAHRRVAPDLGELYALQLLKNISTAVSQVHRPGVLFTLVLDGRAYRPFYGYSDDEAMPYSSHLQRHIDLIGARGRLQIVDMHDLMTARRGELDEIDEKVRREVAATWDDQSFGHRKDLVRALRQGTETTAISAAFIELTKSGDIEGVDAQALLREAVEIVGERAEHTAFEYAVLLTKLRELDVLGAAFPQAVRGTVHPKPGQYSPRIKNPATRISPWHGVAIRTPSGEIRTEYESRIYQEFESYEGVFIAGDEAPFFYRSIGH
ncbi:L-tyrosine/L-tryptophan isonitrile synthase family protein [Rathayibacter sp. VKM Ac-2856]|nr:L-tyrosine/L-tryptophan isonitrile synthase family protein [Rathayibacter sp. VKM Ac-2858]NQX20088.1 L-tyrosine/L-tryptophan isonitrile synthase family protein [Rathayibacter sp. VKM Ac-2856]